MESQVLMVGVDTHKDGHSAAAVDGLGGVVAAIDVGADPSWVCAAAAVGSLSELATSVGGRGHRQLWRRTGELPGRER